MRWVVLLALMLAACSKGPEADLQYIKQARSAAAEWALVNEQAVQSKVTPAYVSSIHKWLLDEVHTSFTSLTEPDSRYGDEIAALLQQPDDAAPQDLRTRAASLKKIEDDLESA